MKIQQSFQASIIIFVLTMINPLFAMEDVYPAKPIRLLVGFPSGSSADVAARIISKKTSEILGQAIVIDNKPGASSNIATEAVVRSLPDGYTLLLGTVANTINSGMGKNLPFNFSNDLAPVVLLTNLPNILVVHPSIGVSSVQGLIELAQKKPGQLNYASSGNGTSPHLSGELFNQIANVKLGHIPYKGSSQAITDVLSGLVPIMFSPASTALPYINSGALRALAVSTSKRSSVAPKLPTLSEAGLNNYDTSVWFGVLAPISTPREIQDKLNVSFNQALQSADVKAQLITQGMDTMGGSKEEMGKYISQETEKWLKLIKFSGASLE
jgi:tripartite-type tricarboxylate transporter receptor subunit TctC